VSFECSRFFRCIFTKEGLHRTVIRVDPGQKRLDIWICIELRGFFLENQISAHAATGKILDAFKIFGAISMRIEVARAIVFDIFQELDQVESCLDITGTKAKILVLAARILVVQIDVE